MKYTKASIAKIEADFENKIAMPDGKLSVLEALSCVADEIGEIEKVWRSGISAGEMELVILACRHLYTALRAIREKRRTDEVPN